MLGIISLKNEQNKLMKPNSNLNRLDTYDRCMDKNVNSWKLSISGRSNEAWAYANVARHKDIDNSREITWIIIQVKHVSFYDIMDALLRKQLIIPQEKLVFHVLSAIICFQGSWFPFETSVCHR